ncbi:response regulator [Burkholderia sp. L27(2015)]|uniref:response regulator n=1 Tax=Burkholderia sp. L27(2015) TaxID=1641858 RepID=UPI00131BDF70|nr:response regulator transcription factor [Burkholderia sp. L27(2015)]
MQAQTSITPLKVFLVEDSALICERLERLLGAIPGVEVVGSAATAQDALRGLARTGAAVAIIDIRLKDGNGFTVLKGLSSTGSLVVPIMLTNDATQGVRLACRNEGARLFFDKSEDFNRVREAIRELVTDQ